MAHRSRFYVFIVLVVIAAAIGAGLFFTTPKEQAAGSQSRTGRQITPMSKLVNQQPLQTAQQLDKLATTREEARYSRDAVRLADHELDLAFTSALRNARLHPAAETPETKQLNERVRKLQDQVAADQAKLDSMKDEVTKAKGAAAEDLGDRMQLLAAEYALHQDELTDAKRDLMRAGGDDESRLQRLFANHERMQHNDQAQPAPFQTREVFQVPGTTASQLSLIWQLYQKQQKVLDARQLSLSAATDLNAKHDELERQFGSVSETPAGQPASNGSALAAVQKQAENRNILSEYDQRIQDHQQLAQGYADWANLLRNRMIACLHAVLQGLLWIVLIIALVVLGNMGVERVSLKLASDRRRLATVRLLGRFAVQGIGLLLILFVLVGPPNQLSTIIALATAGLTVALKDFIVAFFGWFVLMGKNGIRIGDWVEINGIGGEVVEIGLLRTVLLETGNWADSGHPTGRRVTFVNSFAIEGHYFNFSTSGQWLWDNLEFFVPAGQDPYTITDSVLDVVKQDSAQNARDAEKEWLRATKDHGLRAFSADPALSLRPSASGTNVIVRYITHANERYATRTRLYAQVVKMLQQKRASAVQVQTAAREGQ